MHHKPIKSSLLILVTIGFLLLPLLLAPRVGAMRVGERLSYAIKYGVLDSILQGDTTIGAVRSQALATQLDSATLAEGAGGGTPRNPMEPDLDSILTATTQSTSDSLPILGDSTLVASDSLAIDSTSVSQLKASVDYESQDSIVILPRRSLVRMYGNGKVNYQGQVLEGDFMQMQTDSGNVFSTYIDYPDSLKKERIYAKMKMGEDNYEAKSINYNFHSQRGFITDVITQQGEGFMLAERTKRMENNSLYIVDGKYTTCDNHDHPHFYIAMTKAKVRPGKDLVAGPLYMVLADVPLPIGLPFAFFPFTTTRSSGLIMPSYGEEMERGFYLRNGGYYFALNDYMDLELTGDVYTKGSWGVQARSNYIKRYRYRGSIDASYLVTVRGDKAAGDYSKGTDFRIAWNHSQDPKANPYRTFSANVNYSTSRYNHNNLDALYNPQVMGQNTKSSSISFSQRFPNSPWSFTGSVNIAQRSSDSTISLTLPNISVTMSRIYPFKRKVAVGRERWYEKISLSYSGQLSNSVTEKENKILKTNLVRDWRNGIQHSIPVSASFDIGQYLKLTPSFNYTERWYTSRVEKAYDAAQNRVVPSDTIYGFNRVYDFNASLALSTTVYGFWKPLPFLGDKVNMIRHRMEPSISINYRPDFGAPAFGFWEELNYITPEGRRVTEHYSPFEKGMYGVPGRGKSGSIGFSLGNNLEAKVKVKRDSTDTEAEEFKKISLIESLSLSTSYNLAADSFQWSDLSANIAIRLSESFTLRLGGTFDLYTYDYHEHDGRISPYRVNKLRILNGKGIGRYRGTSTSFSYTFNPQTFDKIRGLFGWKKKEGEDSGKKNNSTPPGGTDGMGDFGNDRSRGMGGAGGEGGGSLLGHKSQSLGEFDPDGYLKTNMNWSLGFNYSLSLGQGEFNPKIKEYDYKWRHDLSFNGNFSPTPNWRFNFSANYNFDLKRITNMTCNISRNLHCWTMTASFIPIGAYKSYHFTVQVNSSILQDLKYQQSNQPGSSRNMWR